MTPGRPPRRDSGKSNLVPALVLAIGAVLAGKFAGAGGGASAAAPTTAHEADAEMAEIHDGKIVAVPTTAKGDAAHSDKGAATTVKGTATTAKGAASTAKGAASTAKGAATTAPKAIHWSYEGSTGPEKWSSLSPDYTACDGTAQSPIDIANPKVDQLVDIAFTYADAPGTVVNNGHTIQVNFKSGSRIVLDKKTYELVQFHLHAPSEHVINGKSFPMEIHLVHKSSDGKLAVIGLMVKPGKENKALAAAWKSMPTHEDEEKESSGNIELSSLLPSDHQTIRYAGSLTTPPCSEGVAWNIITTPIELSQAQIEQFAKLYKGNNRPVIDKKDRPVAIDIGADK